MPTHIHTTKIDSFTTRITSGDVYINVNDIGDGWYEAVAYQNVFGKRVCVNSRAYRDTSPDGALHLLADDTAGLPRAAALVAIDTGACHR